MNDGVTKDRQRTNLTLVERDHRELGEILEALNYHLEPGREQNQVEPLLEQLTRAVALHFALENGLMAATRYTRLQEHRMEHKRLMGLLGDLSKVLREGGPEAAMAPMKRYFLEQEAHAHSEDAHYGLWLNICEGFGGREEA